jgi:glycosyltransferase involved in cell wall biosynthesis
MHKLTVLFMQSQNYFGADSMIHGLLMRYFDRGRVSVSVACSPGRPGAPSASFRALSLVPDVDLRPTIFGASVNFRRPLEIVRDTVSTTLPALRSLAGLAVYAKRRGIEVVHATEKPKDAFYGLVLARAIGARLVVHVHVKVDHSWMSPLTRFAMRHADKLVGVSRFVMDSAIAAGYPEEKVTCVLNAIEPFRFDPATDGSGIRREFGIGSDVPVLSTISRLFPWKGQTELLRALAKVKVKHPNFKLLIVGEDEVRATPGARSYSADLEALAAELGLSDHVVFTGFRSDVAELLAASDIYAMPSFEEPFGVVFLEAMAMQKPVIALDNGGTVEVVEHGKSGLLSPPYDIDRLAENILALLEDPARRREMGAHGRRRVEEYFHPARMADDFERVYRSMLDVSVPVAFGAQSPAPSRSARSEERAAASSGRF